MAKQRKPILQLVLLGMLLVVLPIGSYLYLEWGYDYRVEALGELEDFGPIATAVDYELADQATVDVVYISPLSPSDSVATSLRNVYDAWDQQPLVRFIGIGVEGPELIADTQQSLRISGSEGNLREFARLSAQDAHCAEVPVARRALVVDTSGTVRRCYDLHVGSEVNRLVEHLTMLVPMPEKQDIYLEREVEL